MQRFFLCPHIPLPSPFLSSSLILFQSSSLTIIVMCSSFFYLNPFFYPILFFSLLLSNPTTKPSFSSLLGTLSHLCRPHTSEHVYTELCSPNNEYDYQAHKAHKIALVLNKHHHESRRFFYQYMHPFQVIFPVSGTMSLLIPTFSLSQIELELRTKNSKSVSKMLFITNTVKLSAFYSTYLNRQNLSIH